MNRVTCPHIKRNGTICRRVTTHITGYSTMGCCPKHSARFYSLNYQMRQKYGAEALQPAKTSELLDEALQPAVAYKLSIEAHQSTEIYESSDEKDFGLELFD
ncbi:hypothetical protein C1646_760510 [Rhizophagus diaphanus]|nr:hypothetical protein C1646_760510 [Rhizophagus diaphanus] [Rhizophagus sp. MUCL 43196]